MATKGKEDRAFSRPYVGEEMRTMPTFSFDDAIAKCTDVSSEEVPVLDAPLVTTFVGVDNWTRSCIAVPVVEKGTKSLKQLTQAVCKFLSRLGYDEVCRRQLQESSIATRANLGLRTLSAYAPAGPGHAAGNARVERMIQTIRRQAMCLRLDVEKMYKVRLGNHAYIWTWCFDHAAFLVQRFQVQKQVGMTAHEQVTGAIYQGKLCRFCEPVLYKTQARKKGAIAWYRGIWLGKNEDSDRRIIGTATGICESGTVKRIPGEWNVMLLYTMRGLPWDPRALVADDALKELRQQQTIVVEDALQGGNSSDDEPVVPPVEAVNAMIPHEPRRLPPPPSAVLGGIPPEVLVQQPVTPPVLPRQRSEDPAQVTGGEKTLQLPEAKADLSSAGAGGATTVAKGERRPPEDFLSR